MPHQLWVPVLNLAKSPLNQNRDILWKLYNLRFPCIHNYHTNESTPELQQRLLNEYFNIALLSFNHNRIIINTWFSYFISYNSASWVCLPLDSRRICLSLASSCSCSDVTSCSSFCSSSWRCSTCRRKHSIWENMSTDTGEWLQEGRIYLVDGFNGVTLS